jgi:hypothetical protein
MCTLARTTRMRSLFTTCNGKDTSVVTIDLQVVRNYHLSQWDIDVFTSVIRQCMEDGRSEERTLAAIDYAVRVAKGHSQDGRIGFDVAKCNDLSNDLMGVRKEAKGDPAR